MFRVEKSNLEYASKKSINVTHNVWRRLRPVRLEFVILLREFPLKYLQKIEYFTGTGRPNFVFYVHNNPFKCLSRMGGLIPYHEIHIQPLPVGL